MEGKTLASKRVILILELKGKIYEENRPGDSFSWYVNTGKIPWYVNTGKLPSSGNRKTVLRMPLGKYVLGIFHAKLHWNHEPF